MSRHYNHEVEIIKSRRTRDFREPANPSHPCLSEEYRHPSGCDPAEYEHARRVLIYNDMVTKTGEILYAEREGWMYQPSTEEVVTLIKEMRKKN